MNNRMKKSNDSNQNTQQDLFTSSISNSQLSSLSELLFTKKCKGVDSKESTNFQQKDVKLNDFTCKSVEMPCKLGIASTSQNFQQKNLKFIKSVTPNTSNSQQLSSCELLFAKKCKSSVVSKQSINFPQKNAKLNNFTCKSVEMPSKLDTDKLLSEKISKRRYANANSRAITKVTKYLSEQSKIDFRKSKSNNTQQTYRSNSQLSSLCGLFSTKKFKSVDSGDQSSNLNCNQSRCKHIKISSTATDESFDIDSEEELHVFKDIMRRREFVRSSATFTKVTKHQSSQHSDVIILSDTEVDNKQTQNSKLLTTCDKTSIQNSFVNPLFQRNDLPIHHDTEKWIPGKWFLETESTSSESDESDDKSRILFSTSKIQSQTTCNNHTKTDLNGTTEITSPNEQPPSNIIILESSNDENFLSVSSPNGRLLKPDTNNESNKNLTSLNPQCEIRNEIIEIPINLNLDSSKEHQALSNNSVNENPNFRDINRCSDQDSLTIANCIINENILLIQSTANDDQLQFNDKNDFRTISDVIFDTIPLYENSEIDGSQEIIHNLDTTYYSSISTHTLSTGSNENFNATQKRLRAGMNCISMNKTLKYRGPMTSYEECIDSKNREILKKTSDIFFQIFFQLANDRPVLLILRNIFDWNNCVFKNSVGIYYLNKNYLSTQTQISICLTRISIMLNIEPWYFPIKATNKGSVYGSLTVITSDGDSINCCSKGGTTIPQNIIKITQVISKAYFIIVVEKDSVFKKLISEDVPINLPDLLLLLQQHLKIPIFILVDADPSGIEIMLTYKYGSLACAHVNHHLAEPKIQWLGLIPSEITALGIKPEPFDNRDRRITLGLLKRPYIEENDKAKEELEFLLNNNFKAPIEGIEKFDNYLTDVYLPNKLCNGNYF
ncbi:hypothetical protein FQR65_LT08897 [Abscondita terminalis]|nr:hypothetical protein FQR65_LT08897 [Abscondita terminalis]